MVSTRKRAYELIKSEEEEYKLDVLQNDSDTDDTMDADEDMSDDEVAVPTSSTKAKSVKISPRTGKRVYNYPKKRKDPSIPVKAVTNEQLKELFGYVIHHKLGIVTAAKLANVSKTSARRYYNEYKNDPKHRIPLAKRLSSPGDKPLPATAIKVDLSDKNAAMLKELLKPKGPNLTNEKLQTFFDNVLVKKMTINEAARASKVSMTSARRYYAVYVNDPEHKIPLMKPKKKR